MWISKNISSTTNRFSSKRSLSCEKRQFTFSPSYHNSFPHLSRATSWNQKPPSISSETFFQGVKLSLQSAVNTKTVQGTLASTCLSQSPLTAWYEQEKTKAISLKGQKKVRWSMLIDTYQSKLNLTHSILFPSDSRSHSKKKGTVDFIRNLFRNSERDYYSSS